MAMAMDNTGPTKFKLRQAPSGPMRTYTFPARPGWDTLATKIGQLFEVPATALALTYTDGDGDEITMSSDEELQQYYLGFDGAQPIKFAVVVLTAGGGKASADKVSTDKPAVPVSAPTAPVPPPPSNTLPLEDPEMVAWARSQLRATGIDEQSEEQALVAFSNMLRMFPGRRRPWGWGPCGPGWRRRMFEPPPGDFMGFGYRQPQFPFRQWGGPEYDEGYAQSTSAPPAPHQAFPPSETTAVHAPTAEATDTEMEAEPVAGPSRPSSTVNTAGSPRASSASPQTGSDESFPGLPPFPGAPSRREGGPDHGHRRHRSPSPGSPNVSSGWQRSSSPRGRREHHGRGHGHHDHHGHRGHRVPHGTPMDHHWPPPPGPNGMPPPPPPYPHPYNRGPPPPNFPGGPGGFW